MAEFTKNQTRRKVETQTSTYSYYSGTDVLVLLGNKDLDDWVEEVVATEFAVSESLQPLYEYDKYIYQAKAAGQRVVKGQFVVNFVDPSYIVNYLRGGWSPSEEDRKASRNITSPKETDGVSVDRSLPSGGGETSQNDTSSTNPGQNESGSSPNGAVEQTGDDEGNVQKSPSSEESTTNKAIGVSQESRDINNRDLESSRNNSLWNEVGRYDSNRAVHMHILFNNDGESIKSITLEDISILERGVPVELTNGTVERYRFMARDVIHNEEESAERWNLAVKSIEGEVPTPEWVGDNGARQTTYDDGDGENSINLGSGILQ